MQLKINQARLFNNWKAGFRWIAFNEQKPDEPNIRFFESAKEANDYCFQMVSKGKIWKFTVLANVSNQEAEKPASPIDWNNLVSGITSYCIKAVSEAQTLLSDLASGYYCPAIITKVVPPLKAVDCYKIILADTGKNLSGSNTIAYKEAGSFRKYADASKVFSNMLKVSGDGYDQVMLIGQFKEKVLELSKFGLPMDNSGLLFEKAEIRTEGMGDSLYEYVEVNNPIEDLHIDIPVIVKYQLAKRELLFYDGQLRKVLYPNIKDYLHFAHYYYGKLSFQ